MVELMPRTSSHEPSKALFLVVIMCSSNSTQQGLISNNSLHAGIRAPLLRRKGDMRNDLRCGFQAITARELDLLGTSGVISRIRERVGDAKVYVSVDIDVLDPAFAPGKSSPRPKILKALIMVHVAGCRLICDIIYAQPLEQRSLAAGRRGSS
jgi:arginase family enzyme